jgi:hypothetical protein
MNPRRVAQRGSSLQRKRKDADKDKVSTDNEEAFLFDTDHFHDMAAKGQSFDEIDSDQFDRWLSTVFLESFKSKSNEVKSLHISSEYSRIRFPCGRPTHEILNSLLYPLEVSEVDSHEIAKDAWNVSDQL